MDKWLETFWMPEIDAYVLTGKKKKIEIDNEERRWNEMTEIILPEYQDEADKGILHELFQTCNSE